MFDRVIGNWKLNGAGHGRLAGGRPAGIEVGPKGVGGGRREDILNWNGHRRWIAELLVAHREGALLGLDLDVLSGGVVP